MDYSHLLRQLERASLFELYRLQVAIANELDNPARLGALKQRLIIGMALSYFDSVENRSRQATLLELRQKNVIVFDHEKQHKLVIPYVMLNVDNVDTDIHRARHTEALTANTLKVGDSVGFNNHGEPVEGVIKRLNKKTVTLVTRANDQWRVGYAYLYRVYEGEKGGSQQFIPAARD
jgi:hypothetical protein